MLLRADRDRRWSARPPTSTRRRAPAPSSARRPSVSKRRAHTLPALPPRARARHDRRAAVTREVCPRPHLRNCQPNRAHSRVPRSHPVAVTVARPRGRALVAVRTNQTGDLVLHSRLQEHPDAFPKDISILLQEKPANERRQIHPFWAWPSLQHLRVVLLQPERTHGKMCDGRYTCLAAVGRLISTTYGESNRRISAALPDRRRVLVKRSEYRRLGGTGSSPERGHA